MIDQQMDEMYNIILSIFCGIVITLLIDNFYSKPITQIIYKKNWNIIYFKTYNLFNTYENYGFWLLFIR